MKNSKNSNQKNTFYIILFSVILLSLFTVLLFIKKPASSDGIDLIENFDSALKTGFNEEKDIDKYFPSNKFAFDISLIKDLNVKLFSGDTVTLSNNGIDTGGYKDKVTAGGFRTIFKKMPDNSSTFNYYIKNADSDIHWTITIVIDKKAVLEIKEIVNSTSRIIDKMEIPLSSETTNKLNILFVNDYLIIFSDQQVFFQCKHPELDGKRYIDFSYSGSWNDPRFTVKFNAMDESLKKTLIDRIINQFPVMSFHKYKFSDPSWNLLVFEDSFKGWDSKSIYLRRLKLIDTTMPAIYFLPGTTLEYNIKIPESSRLEFYLAFYYPSDIKTSRDKFIIEILKNKEKTKESREFYCKDYVSGSPQFKRFSIDLKNYAGSRCDLVFKFEADKQSIQRNFPTGPIIALGSPVIYPPKEQEDKNVILISLDTLRPDHLGCYGYKRNTSPEIDKFAKIAVLFMNASAQSDWTLTSHMSLFASLYPFETGYHKGSDVHQNVRFSEKAKLLPEYLKENGYKTGAITAGGYISEYFGFDRGIDYFQIIEKDCSKAMTKTIKWIEESGNSKFFLFFHTYEIHKPYNHNDFVKELDPKTATKKDQTVAAYDSGILYTDRQMGRLFDWLKKKNLYRNTYIIVLSDHGENFDILDRDKIPGMHGVTLYDCEIQVPLIIGGGIDDEADRTVASQVSLVDIMPTILDLLEIPIPEDIRGMSLKEHMTGARKEDRLAYSEAVFGPGEKKAVRNVQYKLIKNLANAKNKKNDEYEFYNIGEDRNERNNIIGKNINVKNILKARLDKIMKEVNERYKSLSIITGKIKIGNQDLEKQLKALGYVGD